MSIPLFYKEPAPDRLIPFDRYPRYIIRKLLREEPQPGGVKRWFLNLVSGLEQIGQPFAINSLSALAENEGAMACVVGKPHVVAQIPKDMPIMYGPGVSAHPFDHKPGECPWEVREIRTLVVSCDWFAEMYRPHVPSHIPIEVWPAGIDTQLWSPPVNKVRSGKVLIYDKIRWDRSYYDQALLAPIVKEVVESGRSVEYIKYGNYKEDQYFRLLDEVDAMIFLCEHETQGFAYLQALSKGVPIFVWERGGLWQDPTLYPARVTFNGVRTTPYFDASCGLSFRHFDEFQALYPSFLGREEDGYYEPRKYILNHLTLSGQAQKYVDIYRKYCG